MLLTEGSGKSLEKSWDPAEQAFVGKCHKSRKKKEKKLKHERSSKKSLPMTNTAVVGTPFL